MASDSQEQRTGRILDFLESKGLRECPVCHGVQFSVGPEHIIMETAHYAEPSAASAVVPAGCVIAAPGSAGDVGVALAAVAPALD